MADPRNYRPSPYTPGTPPTGYQQHQSMGPMTPGGPPGPPPQHQHQQGYGPGFYPQQPRPVFQGGMPVAPQRPFNNGPSQPFNNGSPLPYNNGASQPFNSAPPLPLYPPAFSHNNPSSNNHGGFNHPHPGPGVGPGFSPVWTPGTPGAPGAGPAGRPPFQSYGPGTPSLPHAAPSPMMMSQPQPPRHQEWPVAGRPPSTPSGPGYPPMSAPLGPGQGPSTYVPQAYSPSPAPQPSMPPYNGPGLTLPSYSPSLSSAAASPVLPVSAPPAPAPTPSALSSLRPPGNAAPSNSLANPLAVPQTTAYKPKTSYYTTASVSPKKDTKKPPAIPSPSPSWQSTSSGGSGANHNGYQSSQSQQRPPIHSVESFDADDRPTELIPIDEDQVNMAGSQQHIGRTPLKGNAAVSFQPPPVALSVPTSTAVSPSPSFAAISYLPTSPNASDPDSRPTEMPLQDIFKSTEALRKSDPLPALPPTAKTPSTPLPTSGTKFQPASTFVPSTSYIPSKKDAFKVPPTPLPSSSNSFDPTLKVEVSDLNPVKPLGNSLNDNSNYKVPIDVISKPAIVRQQSATSLDSPISLDGLMESIEAMARPSSSSSLSAVHQSPSNQQPGSSVEYSKPLPTISEDESRQARYSLTDAPSGLSGSSQSPPVSRLVPKRPTSTFLPPPPGLSGISENSVMSTPNPVGTISFNPPSLPTQPPGMNLPFFPPPQFQRQEEGQQISFHHSPSNQSHPPRNHNHSHIGGDAMLLFSQPEFVHNPITSMAAFADRPIQNAPSMVQRAKTLRRAAGMTGATHQQEPTLTPPLPPAKVTQDDLYPYLLRLVLLAQADEAPAAAPSMPITNKDTHKDLVKALRAKVKDILSGKDQNPTYQDPVVKEALGKMEPKQFKASTNAEELMIGFSIEMSRIQQAKHMPTNNRDAQIAIMVSLLRDAIQQDPFVGHEAILQRLDKQVKTTSAKPNNSTAQADELIKVIKELFRFPETVRHQKMNELKRNSTKQVAIEDLKKCASNLDLDSFPYPGTSDYHHKEHHEEFKNRERSALNGFIRVLSAGHPNLASIDMPTRQFHSSEFIFIPQNPKAYYHMLLEMCVDHALATRGGSDPATSLLSTPTRALLIDCGVRWRLTSSWREIILMEVVKERYREGKVSVNFLLDFLQSKFYKDSDVNQWHISEVNMLGDVYGGLNHMIFDNINHDIKDLDNVSAAYFGTMLEILDRVHQQEVYQKLNIDLTPFYEDIKETVLLESIRSYNTKDEEVQKERYENETVPLTKMALFIVSEHGVMKKRFSNPLFGTVDVAAVVTENNLRNFVPLMQNMANMDARKLPISDVFPLYQLCRELVALFELYAQSSSVHFNISTWFRPYVLKYLDTLDASISDWVTAAIKQDQFEEVSVGAGHSSSASDLFAFFYEPLTWVKGLNWPNDYQRATFISRLAKVFCKSVDLYAQYMETMFNGCMPSSVSAVASTEAKSLAEQLASFTFRSESTEATKAAQFVFTPKMCVLMNNIEAVRQRLDDLYRNMDVDEVSQIIRDNEPEAESDPNAPHQFEIVFVCAERLQPMDANEASDPYIILSHEGKEVFRSKTIYANINPRWNEVYEVTLTKDIVYLIRIFDADKMHTDRLCGSQYLCIDPLDYEDYMPHDVWLDLSQIGRLLLRITMRGERDDVQFFFGRTFRSLKRKEADMSGMIVDAMVPCVQACLTEKVLFSNFRSKAMFPFFASSVSSAKVTDVSDVACDNALSPLIDYLEASLPVLYDYLTTEGMTMVITKLWKEILITIESLLMPPLSSAVSDRTPLTEVEMHVVFKIIEFIKLYLNGGDACDGFPLKVLETAKYRDLLTVRPIYDASVEDLAQEYSRALTVPGRGRLGRQESSDFDRRFIAGAVRRPSLDLMTTTPETVLRIMRMQHDEDVEAFIRQAIDTQSKAREARAQAKRDQMAYQRQIMRGQ